MTTRNEQQYSASRPVALNVRCTAAQIRVEASRTRTVRVSIETADSTGPAADAVRDAVITQNGDRIEVRLDDNGAVAVAGIVNNFGVINSGSGKTFVSGSVVGIQAAFVNNSTVIQHSNVVVADLATSPIFITVTVPEGSSLEAGTVSGAVTARGQYHSAQVRTTSGAIEIDTVGALRADSVSGAIDVDRAEDVSATTVSGSIEVVQVGRAECNSTSGAIRIESLAGTGGARTLSGAIDIRYSGPEPFASSLSGRVRLRSR